MSISRRMDKQIIVYSNNGKLFCNKNTITDIVSNRDESPKHCDKQMNPDTKSR